jgi:ComF family protein
MASWLFDLWSQVRWRPTLILPVPLGKKRFRSRGYNQAALIAEGLAGYLNLDIREDMLIRIRETRSQVGLDPLAREQNVHDAFVAKKEFISDSKVLLVDDLVTTGATLSACATALYDAGAQRVFGIAVARA